MLAVEEIGYTEQSQYESAARSHSGRHTGVSGVNLHLFKPDMRTQRRAGPFPYTTHFTLSCQFVPVRGNGNWVPVLKTDIGVGEVHEDGLGFGSVTEDRRVSRTFTFEDFRVAITNTKLVPFIKLSYG